MSREEDEADDPDPDPGDDRAADPHDDRETEDPHLDDEERPNGRRRTDRTTDDEPGDGSTGEDGTSDSGPSGSPRSRSDEFGIASDLVAGEEGATDDVDPTDPGEEGGDPKRTRETDDEPATSSASPPDEASAEADAPLSSLASSVDQRRERTTDRSDDELFDEEDVPEIDADVVWEQLGEDEPPEIPEATERDVRVIEKRSYCEQCPFFATPPDVSCNHEGTEILEMVDMEHFRVVDCPKVHEDERLERL